MTCLFDTISCILSAPLVFFSFGDSTDWPKSLRLLVDAASWAVLGARPQASRLITPRWNSTGDGDEDPLSRPVASLGVISTLLRWNPMSWLGRPLVGCVERENPSAPGDRLAPRQRLAAFKAMGETLVVDSLFVALGFYAEASGGWDFGFPPPGAIAASVSILAAGTELARYRCSREVDGAEPEPEPPGSPEQATDVEGGYRPPGLAEGALGRPSLNRSKGFKVSTKVREMEGPARRVSIVRESSPVGAHGGGVFVQLVKSSSALSSETYSFDWAIEEDEEKGEVSQAGRDERQRRDRHRGRASAVPSPQWGV